MIEEYVLADDKGICEFCGQPIELHEQHLFVRRVEEDEARICHSECYYLACEEYEENYSNEEEK